MGKDEPLRMLQFEIPPTCWPLQFGGYGMSSEEEWSSTGDLVGKTVVESELSSSGTTLEYRPMPSVSTSIISEASPFMGKAVKRSADHQDGGDDEIETIAKDSERSVRRRENVLEEYGNNSFEEEPEKIRHTQERAHLEKDMKETSVLWDSDTGSLSEQLDVGSQALDKNVALDLRSAGKEVKVITDEIDSGEEYSSPEYNPSSEVENHDPWLAPESPSTKQRRIENTRKLHMATATRALDYYHTKHHGDDYTPVHVNLKHVIYFIDTRGYYIHMNFTAQNTKDGAENIFFAELYLSYDSEDGEWVVTACDIIGPKSLGGLRHVWRPNGMSFYGGAIDIENCYVCDDFIKHIDGAMYEAGHGGPAAYEVTDISVE